MPALYVVPRFRTRLLVRDLSRSRDNVWQRHLSLPKTINKSAKKQDKNSPASSSVLPTR